MQKRYLILILCSAVVIVAGYMRDEIENPPAQRSQLSPIAPCVDCAVPIARRS